MQWCSFDRSQGGLVILWIQSHTLGGRPEEEVRCSDYLPAIASDSGERKKLSLCARGDRSDRSRYY